MCWFMMGSLCLRGTQQSLAQILNAVENEEEIF